MCVLRASGVDFDVDAFLGSSSLKPCAIHRRGSPRAGKAAPRGRGHESSGLAVAVSGAPWSDLTAQVSDAEQFLAAHQTAIRDLVGFPGVDEATLDFPLELRIGDGVAAQFDRFPASLVAAAGRLGLALELSLYPVAPERRAAGRARQTVAKRSARRSAGPARSHSAR